MKRIILLFASVLLLATACKNKEVYPTFGQPGWAVEFNPDHNASMTAVVRLPDNLAPYAAAGDELAAFIGDECRGVGQLIDGVYFLLIKGTPDEQSSVSIRYYSAGNRYLYCTASGFEFDADGTYGTADAPQVLPLVVLEN